MKSRSTRRAPLATAVLLFASAAATASAQVIGDRPWSMVGAAGVMDRTNITRANFYDDGWVEITPTANSLTLRYPVTAVDGLLETAPMGGLTSTQLQVAFRDAGLGAVVEATLFEHDPASPVAEAIPLLSLSSDSYAASPDFQVQRVGCSQGVPAFDFVNRVYFVEARLRRYGDVALPALASLQLARAHGCLVIP
jgi:hypothetical protein